MENASKALIIAGAVLIAILIVSLGVAVFMNMSNSVKNDTSLDKQAIASFNSKLTPYVGKNISGSQVNALIQLAISINSTAINNSDDIRVVTINVDGKTYVSKDLVKKNNCEKVETGKYYKVEPVYNVDSGLINVINVTSNS